jgi:xanthine dehydrogenase molybdopterin binding subunit
MCTDTQHASAEAHVTGAAVYVDDMAMPDLMLHGRVVCSPHAHAKLLSMDLTAARAVTGVHAVLSFRDIPGHNNMGPVVKDEPCLAADEVLCIGQAVALIAAETREQCLEAERLLRISYETLEAVLDIRTAMEGGVLMGPPRLMEEGDLAAVLKSAPYRVSGELETGAQEHWYLETQVALCIPGEGQEMTVYSSTQHPSETQALVADVLGIPRNEVVVEVRRLGGGFGGKETQANHPACWAALLAAATRRPVKIRLSRDDDMIMTGKRHRFLTRYEAGFDARGVLLGAKLELNSDGGMATDLSFAILERAMLHADNAYYVPNVAVTGCVWKTNLPSNTAFRGFGGPQGMAAMETIIDRVARVLGMDAADVRSRNLYGRDARSVTHYGQIVEENHLPAMFERLMVSSSYRERRSAANVFNASHEFRKRGLALTPVKFGISFTTTFLNQAGALVLIYTDGTVLVNHGGVEMGQGLHTKIRSIVAAELGIHPERVKVNATSTARVPNTSPTAASSGADMNGMAVKNALDILKERIAGAVAPLLTGGWSGDPTRPGDVIFAQNCVADSRHPDRSMLFSDAMQAVHFQRVSLSSTGFYRTPDIGWDRQAGRGRPFSYYAFGMAVTEVEVDVLTGAHTILRADILHDVGDSLNPGIDRGQIEGGYVQGVGWCTTEEVLWDNTGHLLTHSPDTYKIPAAGDVPEDFRVEMLAGVPHAGTIGNSKAVGEPPFMLALSAWLAIKDAVSAVDGHQREPRFALPATREVILGAAEDLRGASDATVAIAQDKRR